MAPDTGPGDGSRRGRVELTLHVPLSPGLRGWVLSWVPEVEVVEPAGLAREVAEALEAGLLRVARRRRARGVTSSVTGVGYGTADDAKGRSR